MAKLHLEFTSKILNKKTDICIVAPLEQGPITADCRVLLLLHGMGNHACKFYEKIDLEVIASKYNLIIITPFVATSFYCNLATGENYFDYMKDEVMDVVNGLFDRDIKTLDRYIMGVSMGGYGAFKLALFDPSLYKAVGSVSGSLDIMTRDLEKRQDGAEIKAERERMFGTKMDPDNDLFKYLHKDLTIPMYICCGHDDYLKVYNDKFVKVLNELNVEHTYVEDDGMHEWEYFIPHVELCITWLMTKGE